MSIRGWSAIDEGAGLYELEKVVDTGWSWRAVALRTQDGELLVVSPVRGSAEHGAQSLEALGRPRFALAPNHFHYLGLRELRQRYPELECTASSVATPRLTSKCAHAFAPLDAVRERLPKGVSILEPPGTKSGETWLRVPTARGVVWVVSDAFFHVTRPLSGGFGLALRLTGTAPGLRIGSTYLWLALKDRPAYKRWLEAQLEADAPVGLIPGHGEPIDDAELAPRLRELVRRRV
jgi:hypothetical protein